MGRIDEMRRALELKEPANQVPLWELHFHPWARLAKEKFITGKEYMAVDKSVRRDVLKRDAEIIVDVGEKLKFNAVSVPDGPWDCIYTLPVEDRLTLVMDIKALKPDFMVIASCGAHIGMPSSADHYVEFCYQIMDNPEQIDKIAERTYNNGIKGLSALIDAGVDAVYSGADLADNRGPFFSPDQLDRWVWPYQHKWALYAQKRGVYSIMHTDGNIMPLIDKIAQNGVNGLQALDPVAGVDIDKAFDLVEGRLCLCGNVDCGLMLAGTPEQVYRATAELLKAQSFRKGFVLGNSNAIVIDTPLENYYAYLDAWHDYGKVNAIKHRSESVSQSVIAPASCES